MAWRPSCWWRDLCLGNGRGCAERAALGAGPLGAPTRCPPGDWAGSALGALEGPSPDSGCSSLLTGRALVLSSHESQIRWI